VLQCGIRSKTPAPRCRPLPGAAFNALRRAPGTRWDSAAILQVIEDMKRAHGVIRAACIPDRKAIFAAWHLRMPTSEVPYSRSTARTGLTNGFHFLQEYANEKIRLQVWLSSSRSARRMADVRVLLQGRNGSGRLDVSRSIRRNDWPVRLPANALNYNHDTPPRAT